jgi:proteasome accessory factor C
MADNAAQRALRTMDLIPYILENPGITTTELAEKFNTTQKQIEKDLQLIFLCGLPGYTPYELIDLTFEDGIVSVIEPQVLNKPRKFSSSEMVVIKLGLEILREINADDMRKLTKIDKILNKINSGADQNSFLLADQINSTLFYSQISLAISQKRILNIEYKSLAKDNLSKRKILPGRISMSNGNLYLSAYDIERQSDRVFKMELISSCDTGEIFKENPIQSNVSDRVIELRVDEKLTNFIERNTSIIIAQQKVTGGLQVTLKVSNLEWLARSIVSFAPDIMVISPASLSEMVNQRVRDLLATYANYSSV